jgi:hypothetical protein
LLKEFGVVAALISWLYFYIAYFYSYSTQLPTSSQQKTRALSDNKFLEKVLVRIERWTFHHSSWVYATTIIITIVSIIGITRLKSEGFM